MQLTELVHRPPHMALSSTARLLCVIFTCHLRAAQANQLSVTQRRMGASLSVKLVELAQPTTRFEVGHPQPQHPSLDIYRRRVSLWWAALADSLRPKGKRCCSLVALRRETAYHAFGVV